jgi:hypothetical protein
MGDSIMPSIIRATTTNGLQIAPDNSGSLQLQTNGTTTALTIDTSQNLGVGVTSPSCRGDFRGTSGLGIKFQETSSGNTNRIELGTGSGIGYVNADAGVGSIALGFNVAGTERMRIDSSGRLLVGTTSSGGLGGLTTIPNYDGDTAGLIWNKSNATSTGAAEFRYNGTQKGYIAYTSTATTYNTTSDYRLKENIEPMVNALEKVALLNPVTYTWIESGENGQGFIAHELQNVVPECVFGEKDAVNEDGSIKPQGIDTSFLVATLTAAIQEQQTIINDLKARIETLEAK